MSVVRKTPKSRRDARAVRSNLGQLTELIRGRKIESRGAIKMAKNILNYVGLGEGNKFASISPF